MTDVALQNALAEMQKLQDEREKTDQLVVKLRSELSVIDERLAKVSSFIQSWYQFAGEPAPAMVIQGAAAGHSASRSAVSATAKIVDNPKKELIARAALDLINDRGEPIQRPDLYEWLKARNLEVRGADPLVTLSTMLWRMKGTIIHLHGHGYWDPALPYAPANYSPEGDKPMQWRPLGEDASVE